MSIVLQGSTSGSITLQEPAVAGSNTINLPAATGTAVLTGVSGNVDINAAGSNNVTLSTNSTERMRITSGGQLVISSNLSISGNTASGGSLGLTSGNSTTPIVFYTGEYGVTATERMRIDSSGRLLVGRTAAGLTNSTGVTIGDGSIGIQSEGNNVQLYLNRTTSDGTIVEFRRNNTGVGSISVTTTATAYNTSSDYRLKENIAPMTGALGLVQQLKPVTYNWKIDGSAGQGFIAHELQAVVPDCVSGEKDAVETYTDEEGNEQTRPVYQGVDTSFLVATLTAAIQELKGIVDTQATKIAELEAKLEGTA